MKQNKIISVRWDDPCTRSGWVGDERAREYKASEVATVGFQVHRSRQKVVVALSRDDDGSVSDVITIPMSCVKGIRRLE